MIATVIKHESSQEPVGGATAEHESSPDGPGGTTPEQESKKRICTRRDVPDSVVGTIAKWKEVHRQCRCFTEREKSALKAPAKGSQKVCRRGRGGPDFAYCACHGVTKHTCGKCDSETRIPNSVNWLRMASYYTASEAACACVKAAKVSQKARIKRGGGPENAYFHYHGVRQRSWGSWVAEIRKPNDGKRLWLGTFPTALEAAHAYDEAATAMHLSRARLNFPEGGQSCIGDAEGETIMRSYEATITSHHSDDLILGSYPPSDNWNLARQDPRIEAGRVPGDKVVKFEHEDEVINPTALPFNLGTSTTSAVKLEDSLGHDSQVQDLPEDMFPGDELLQMMDNATGNGGASDISFDLGQIGAHDSSNFSFQSHYPKMLDLGHMEKVAVEVLDHNFDVISWLREDGGN